MLNPLTPPAIQIATKGQIEDGSKQDLFENLTRALGTILPLYTGHNHFKFHMRFNVSPIVERS
jgi:hypothetical protein